LLVWLVNPFDPIPGEEEQLRRYAYLAASLREAGHRVVWWSSDFSHRFKRLVDKTAVERAAKALGIVVRLIPTPPYPRNLALAIGGTKKHHAVFHLGADSHELQRLMASGASRYGWSCRRRRRLGAGFSPLPLDALGLGQAGTGTANYPYPISLVNEELALRPGGVEHVGKAAGVGGLPDDASVRRENRPLIQVELARLGMLTRIHQD
jgi:hypothetical protein